MTYQDWRHQFDELLLEQRSKFDSLLIIEKEKYQKVRAENSRINEDLERAKSQIFSLLREKEDQEKEVSDYCVQSYMDDNRYTICIINWTKRRLKTMN